MQERGHSTGHPPDWRGDMSAKAPQTNEGPSRGQTSAEIHELVLKRDPRLHWRRSGRPPVAASSGGRFPLLLAERSAATGIERVLRAPDLKGSSGSPVPAVRNARRQQRVGTASPTSQWQAGESAG